MAPAPKVSQGASHREQVLVGAVRRRFPESGPDLDDARCTRSRVRHEFRAGMGRRLIYDSVLGWDVAVGVVGLAVAASLLASW